MTADHHNEEGDQNMDDELQKIANDWAFEKCPRCLGQLRKSLNDRGAWSRADRGSTDDVTPAVIVCSACGNDEAIRTEYTGVVIAPDEWPVLNGAHEFAVPTA